MRPLERSGGSIPINPDIGSGSDLEREYSRSVWLKVVFIVACCIAVFAVGGLALSMGERSIPFMHVYELAWDHLCGATYEYDSPGWWDDFIVWEIRMPRIVMGVVAGASLSLGGVIMQGMMKNPLADPYTTGISSGACFGAVAAVVVGTTFSAVAEDYAIVTNAFIGSLVPALLVIAISSRVRASPVTMILAGTAISYMFNALTTIIMVAADESKLAAAYAWQVGSLGDAVWDQIPFMAVVSLIGMIVMMLMASRLNLLLLGDEGAHSLGLDVQGFRKLCLVILAFMTASIVSFTGIIGFVGLIVPHAARFFIGSDNRYLIPASMALGSLVMISADLVARLISKGSIPVGIVMSFAGGFVFLLLVMNMKSGRGTVRWCPRSMSESIPDMSPSVAGGFCSSPSWSSQHLCWPYSL